MIVFSIFQVYIGTDNVNKSAEAAKLVMKELGGNLIIEPVLLSDINVKLTGFSDPDNWITVNKLLISS